MDIFIHNSVTATIIQVEHYFTRAATINVRPFRQNIDQLCTLKFTPSYR